MSYALIGKDKQHPQLEPNLADYEAGCRDFSWQSVQAQMNGLGPERLNIAYEAVDRHLATPLADKVALRFLAQNDLAPEDITYRELAERSSCFASLLDTLGVGPGERVFCLANRCPDLYVAALGTLKRGCVFTPLFSAFGPDPIRCRMEIGEPAVLVTTAKLYRKKMASWIGEVRSVRHILLIDTDSAEAGTIVARDLMRDADPHYLSRPMTPEDTALLHFTSGTTGRPKGAVHVHQAVLSHYITGKYALDLHPRDIYWCTADPGWVTGTSYGFIAPLCNGVTLVVDEAEFDAERWYRILQEQKVTVWYTAPTAIRMLMKHGPELARHYDLSALRFLASVGEPLNPEAVIWGMETLGMPFHDNWWQTETGGIMIANFASMAIKPGSMGKPLPGIEAAIATRDEQGGMTWVEDPAETGELVLKAGWPSMFRGYLHEEERYRKAFVGDWYFSGDLARRDEDGYFWFIGRADDVIKSSGHLIGPFEVECVLMEHPAVAEAGVIGVPDDIAGEAVKAFVALKPGYSADDALYKDILGLARKRLGPAVAPKTLAFSPGLPKTRSGKIMRRLLKARELGLPEGDLSTLEGGGSNP